MKDMSSNSRLVLQMPWPSAKLSPNTRGKWQHNEADKKQAKQHGYWVAIQAIAEQGAAPSGPLQVLKGFMPPNRRHYDTDNLGGRMKYYLDGVFMALGQDDYIVEATLPVRGPVTQGGKVIVILQPMEISFEKLFVDQLPLSRSITAANHAAFELKQITG